MGRRSNAYNAAQAIRAGFGKALELKFGKNLSRVELMAKAWKQVIEQDGMAEALRIHARYCPKEMLFEVDEESKVIPVIGAVPVDAEAWGEQFGAKPAITVDGTTGEVISGDEPTEH